MNKIILSGNLSREIELKTTSTEKEYLQNAIAVRRDYKNADGTYDTDFFNFTAWGAQAVYLAKYASMGSKVILSGRLQNREYEVDGQKRIATGIVVENVEIISSKPKKVEETEQVEETDDLDGLLG